MFDNEQGSTTTTKKGAIRHKAISHKVESNILTGRFKMNIQTGTVERIGDRFGFVQIEGFDGDGHNGTTYFDAQSYRHLQFDADNDGNLVLSTKDNRPNCPSRPEKDDEIIILSIGTNETGQSKVTAWCLPSDLKRVNDFMAKTIVFRLVEITIPIETIDGQRQLHPDGATLEQLWIGTKISELHHALEELNDQGCHTGLAITGSHRKHNVRWYGWLIQTKTQNHGWRMPSAEDMDKLGFNGSKINPIPEIIRNDGRCMVAITAPISIPVILATDSTRAVA